MSIDDATPQEWDSLRGKTMQERFDINNTYKKEFNEALDRHLELEEQKASDVQVGGSHYKKFIIQPAEFCHKNNIPYLEATAIKYLCRWRDKGGIQDLQKAKHFIDLLMEYEDAHK